MLYFKRKTIITIQVVNINFKKMQNVTGKANLIIVMMSGYVVDLKRKSNRNIFNLKTTL
jgi:hypothetical protein